jgi:hypothetical protein
MDIQSGATSHPPRPFHGSMVLIVVDEVHLHMNPTMAPIALHALVEDLRERRPSQRHGCCDNDLLSFDINAEQFDVRLDDGHTRVDHLHHRRLSAATELEQVVGAFHVQHHVEGRGHSRGTGPGQQVEPHVGDWLHGELYPPTLHYDHSGRDVKAEANRRDNQREEGDAYP